MHHMWYKSGNELGEVADPYAEISKMWVYLNNKKLCSKCPPRKMREQKQIKLAPQESHFLTEGVNVINQTQEYAYILYSPTPITKA